MNLKYSAAFSFAVLVFCSLVSSKLDIGTGFLMIVSFAALNGWFYLQPMSVFRGDHRAAHRYRREIKFGKRVEHLTTENSPARPALEIGTLAMAGDREK